jgi:hypothetical protein
MYTTILEWLWGIPSTTTDGKTYDDQGIPYVQLNEEYDSNVERSWTNDPKKLYLSACFDPKDEVIVANDYNIDGLCPVVKETKGDEFILRDDKGRWYLWDAWVGELMKFRDWWIEGFTTKEELVENLVCNMTEAQADVEFIERKRRDSVVD